MGDSSVRSAGCAVFDRDHPAYSALRVYIDMEGVVEPQRIEADGFIGA